MKYYKTKSSLYLLLFLLPLVYSYFYLNERRISVFYWFIVIPLFSFFSRGYLIRDETLKIPSEYININSILKIERRKFNIKSKYFSFDKIVLTFDEDVTVKISPKDEQNFITHLLSINPNIEVNI
ncbi:PH domain-containing protein [Flavobacterium sp. WC2509]|uniref:PH domain-containing protein n=1 Tax=Flavobacterium sp. WC2509 TaxID=3461406 RepID=UPI0040439DFB